MYKSELRYRQIHLDFHTSELIPGVAEDFNPIEFASVLKSASVDSVTSFAKCHHGWSYYPSKVGTMHPQLKRNLLGEMVETLRKNDIQVPIYMTVQWDEKTAREEPGLRVIKADNTPFQATDFNNSSQNQLLAQWHPICLSNKIYIERIIAQTEEIVNLFHPDGMFYDILLPWECVCPNCLDAMKKRGLNPEIAKDRLENHKRTIQDYYETMFVAVKKIDNTMRFFHNSGHIYKNERNRWKYFSHLELESLPTGGWGYDHFPLSARYANTLGLNYLGMTGKFHTTWGEFGGFKKPVALEYECLQMVAMGARCSIGDQLHPRAFIDKATYDTISPAYKRIEKIEKYAKGAIPKSEVAIFSAEGHFQDRTFEPNDIGCARMLLEMQVMFDVIDCESDFSKYKVIFLPDAITLDEGTQSIAIKKFNEYLKQGGKIVMSGSSGMNTAKDNFVLPLRAKVNGMSSFQPDYIKVLPGLDNEIPTSPFVMYQRPYAVKCDGAEVLAETRVPYFNRKWDHFCSHQHTPFIPERNECYDGILAEKNIIYFSHPIFLNYFNQGQPLNKYMVRGALNKLLPERSVNVILPSSGRISYMSQPEEKRDLLHVLFCQSQLRGENGFGWTGHQKMEIIEDAVPLYDVECDVAIEREIKKEILGTSALEIPFSMAGGRIKFVIPELYLHEVIVLAWE